VVIKYQESISEEEGTRNDYNNVDQVCDIQPEIYVDEADPPIDLKKHANLLFQQRMPRFI
jgi:hypothetical protein